MLMAAAGSKFDTSWPGGSLQFDCRLIILPHSCKHTKAINFLLTFDIQTTHAHALSERRLKRFFLFCFAYQIHFTPRFRERIFRLFIIITQSLIELVSKCNYSGRNRNFYILLISARMLIAEPNIFFVNEQNSRWVIELGADVCVLVNAYRSNLAGSN